MRTLLRRAEEALRAVGKAALTVRPTLDQPYPDAPEWTPWTRFLEGPARAAFSLGFEIDRRLRGPDFKLPPGD
jgi:hypothetical protein